LVAHNKREVKAKMMILDAIKDHLIPHISEKKTMKEMFNALVSLYKSESINKKMILQNILKSIVMNKSDLFTSYLMEIKQIHDQLAKVREKVEDAKLVNMPLDGI
jgi:2-phosphoglycerate kinase